MITRRHALTGLAVMAVAATVLGGTLVAVESIGDAKPRTVDFLPSPVPLPDGLGKPDTVTMEPRTDVLTYTVLSDQWADYETARQEKTCTAWQGGWTFDRKGKLVEISQDALITREINRASADQAGWIERDTVRQFLDETCAVVMSKGEVGEGVSVDRKAKR